MTSSPQNSYLASMLIYFRPEVVRMLLLGFSAGLPILLVFSSLSPWLREAGVERSTIGFFSWVSLAYALKWIWAPAIDKLAIPFLSNRFGRRRSWLFVAQIGLVLCISAMAMTDPKQHLYIMSLAAFLVAFFSATQDIVIDAYRIESAESEYQAAMAATYQVGYRVAMIVASAGVLGLADWFQTIPDYDASAWQTAYFIMASLMAVGILTTYFSPEPPAFENVPKPSKQTPLQRVKNAFIDPVLDLLQRYGWFAITLIILICTYRVSDIVLGVMANVFYIDMGFTKSEIAVASKTYGLIMTLAGAILAGSLVSRFGILNILLIGSVASALTNILFIWLAQSGHDLSLLYAVISIDNLSAGIAATSFIAFLSSLANKEFTATQYAWLSSAMLLFPKFLGGFSGVWLDAMGYYQFFTMTALMGVPTTLAILYLKHKKWHA